MHLRKKDMNRELIVKLLKKNIDDLILLTEGFEEMTTYPTALIHLALLKTNDIKEYLHELDELKQTRVPVAGIAPLAHPFSSEASATEEIPVDKPDQEEFLPEVTTTCIPAIEEDSPVLIPESQELPLEENIPLQQETIEEPIQLIEEQEGEIQLQAEPELQADVQNDHSDLAVSDDQNDDSELLPDNEEVLEQENAAEPKNVKQAVIQPVGASEPHPVVDVEPGKESDEKQLTLGDKLSNGISRNDLLSSREPDRFSNSLANKKIDDIRQAISIGDRFRFQRELFRNNGEEMNKMLNYINLLASFEEIETFLRKKYGWATDNQVAQDFYAIVKRKFI